jgi:hypothetical protein
LKMSHARHFGGQLRRRDFRGAAREICGKPAAGHARARTVQAVRMRLSLKGGKITKPPPACRGAHCDARGSHPPGWSGESRSGARMLRHAAKSLGARLIPARAAAVQCFHSSPAVESSLPKKNGTQPEPRARHRERTTAEDANADAITPRFRLHRNDASRRGAQGAVVLTDAHGSLGRCANPPSIITRRTDRGFSSLM